MWFNDPIEILSQITLLDEKKSRLRKFPKSYPSPSIDTYSLYICDTIIIEED